MAQKKNMCPDEERCPLDGSFLVLKHPAQLKRNLSYNMLYVWHHNCQNLDHHLSNQAENLLSFIVINHTPNKYFLNHFLPHYSPFSIKSLKQDLVATATKSCQALADRNSASFSWMQPIHKFMYLKNVSKKHC